MELMDKTFGIVGFGNIGQQVGRIAHAFGMKVIYTSQQQKHVGFGSQVDVETLFAESDVVSLHCPLSANNQQFVNEKLLQTMKSSAILINTARGGLIQEQDLADALDHKVIAGAALDVLSAEPPPDSNPLLRAKNCIITPHNAWISREARERIMQITTDNIAAFLNERPINVVN
jgi:glycerate dehydrogenase